MITFINSLGEHVTYQTSEDTIYDILPFNELNMSEAMDHRLKTKVTFVTKDGRKITYQYPENMTTVADLAGLINVYPNNNINLALAIVHRLETLDRERQWEEWMKKVDSRLESAMGLTSADLDDYDWHSDFTDGLTPSESASNFMENYDG